MDTVSIATAFFAGLLSFLAPCVLPIIPGFLAYLSGVSFSDVAAKRRQVFLHSIFFVLGFSAVFAALGVILNSALRAAAIDVRPWLSRAGGAMIIFFGLYLVGLIRIPFLEREHKIKLRPLGQNAFGRDSGEFSGSARSEGEGVSSDTSSPKRQSDVQDSPNPEGLRRISDPAALRLGRSAKSTAPSASLAGTGYSRATRREGILTEGSSARGKTGLAHYATSFLFGATFAVGWTPCVGPALGGILGLVASSPGSALYLLLAYSLGLGLPFLAVGFFTGEASTFINRHIAIVPYFRVVFGVILIVLGIFVFTNNLVLIANFGFINKLLLR